MHKIYIEKRCIIICPPYEQALTDPNAVQFSLGENIGIGGLISMFETSSSLARIYIPAEDTEDVYRKICREFKEVEAAGGLVRNRRGDFLLIKRSGLWDLPKGHHENGEDMRTTAHTWWYDMLYDIPTELTPQTEEDISKAAWVAKSSLPNFLINTYPSILEVFKEAKI